MANSVLKNVDTLYEEVDAAVHLHPESQGKITGSDLNAVLKSLATELTTHEQQTVLSSAKKADLDAGGRVPSSQLPSYVDDILEAASYAALPTPGEAGKVYVTLDTNKQYRWSGSAYALLSDSGLTTAVKAALEASQSPSATNTFATQADVTAAMNSSAGGGSANDANVVHKTGDERISGDKAFTSPVTIAAQTNDGLRVSITGGDSGVPVAQFLAPNHTGNIFLATGQQLSGSALLGFASTGAGPHAFITTYGRPEADFTISASDGYTGIGTNTPAERLDVQGNVKAQKFIGDGSRLTNLPGATAPGKFTAITASGSVGYDSLAAAVTASAQAVSANVPTYTLSDSLVIKSRTLLGNGLVVSAGSNAAHVALYDTAYLRDVSFGTASDATKGTVYVSQNYTNQVGTLENTRCYWNLQVASSDSDSTLVVRGTSYLNSLDYGGVVILFDNAHLENASLGYIYLFDCATLGPNVTATVVDRRPQALLTETSLVRAQALGRDRGAWVAGTAYARYDFVTYNGQQYYAPEEVPGQSYFYTYAWTAGQYLGRAAAATTAATYLQISSTSAARVAEVPVPYRYTLADEVLDVNATALTYQLDKNTRSGTRQYGATAQTLSQANAQLAALTDADLAAGVKLYIGTTPSASASPSIAGVTIN